MQHTEFVQSASGMFLWFRQEDSIVTNSLLIIDRRDTSSLRFGLFCNCFLPRNRLLIDIPQEKFDMRRTYMWTYMANKANSDSYDIWSCVLTMPSHWMVVNTTIRLYYKCCTWHEIFKAVHQNHRTHWPVEGKRLDAKTCKHVLFQWLPRWFISQKYMLAWQLHLKLYIFAKIFL